MAFTAGQKLRASSLNRIGDICATYARQSGTQAISAGDNGVAFPTAVLTSSRVTPHGTNNLYFTLSAGDWLVEAAVRMSTTDETALFLATGQTFTNENNAWIGENATCIQKTISGVIKIPSGTQDVIVGLYSGAGSRTVVAWGSNMTHVTFTQLSDN